jgi:hypothetical protein
MTTLSYIAQQTVRWLARGISTLAAGIWLLILLDILACDALAGFICMNWEMALLVGMASFSMLSVILAWRWEGIGGFVMVLWGLVFSGIAYLTSRPQQVFSMLVSGVPFLIAGFLFLVSWWSRKVDLNEENVKIGYLQGG